MFDDLVEFRLVVRHVYRALGADACGHQRRIGGEQIVIALAELGQPVDGHAESSGDHVESAFDKYAISHAGAMGLMQLMPTTAANYQLNQNQFDPNRNIEAGVQHLKELMSRYNNDKTLSLAAYNAGEGAVRRYNGVPPYEETETYIKRVMKLYDLYKKEI